MAKEVKMTSSFCYNEEDFKEVMANIGKGKASFVDERKRADSRY